jgi:hypothetical protein
MSAQLSSNVGPNHQPMDPLLREVCVSLERNSRAHTILLYGSRANGTENEFSDYDIAAFADVPAAKRDTRVVAGQFLDVFLHPEAVLAAPITEHLTLRGSRILVEDYFALRGMWYQGPKKSFQWLREFDAATHRAFENALKPSASFDAIDGVVGFVIATPVPDDATTAT